MVACDRKRVYRRDDCNDPARWLSVELGISPWKARRLLNAGYALDHLPVLASAFERGELSTDKFVELARFVSPDTEAELLTWAKRTSPAGIRARAEQELRVPTEDVRDADRWRSLAWEWDEAKTRLSGWFSFPPDQGAEFVKGVERQVNRMPVSPEDSESPNVREARRADALVAMASASIANDQSPDRATIVVHTDIDGVLDGDKNGVLHGGLPLPPEATDLVACDSRVQIVLHDEAGAMFHISSPSYVVPKWMRRQVEHRDGYRCTFPGCGTRAFTDIHHIVPWPIGPTQPSNLIVLCRTHHRLIHIHKWHVDLRKNGETAWFRPDWSPYEPRPAPGPEDPSHMQVPHGAPRAEE